MRSTDPVPLRPLDLDFSIQVTPSMAPFQEGRELAGLMKDGRLLGSLPLRIRPPPVEKLGDLLGVDVGDFVLGEVGNCVGLEKGDDREVSFRRLSLGPRKGLEILDHLGEVRACDGLSELGLDPELIEQLVSELPGLVKVRGARSPIDVASSIWNLEPAEPELLRPIFELVEDDFPVVERLLIDDFGGGHGAILPLPKVI